MVESATFGWPKGFPPGRALAVEVSDVLVIYSGTETVVVVGVDNLVILMVKQLG